MRSHVVPRFVFIYPRHSYLPSNSKKGEFVARIYVIPSPFYSRFTGTLILRGNRNMLFAIQDNTIVLARDLRDPNDISTVSGTVIASQNGGTASSNFTLTIIAVAPPPQRATPTAVNLSSDSITLPVDSKAGTEVLSFTVTMSDGSDFSGTVDVMGPA